ncbi:hypothetical protein [Periweissella beninensis]|uniref:Uncharacterized protein n=1 Tax=Periweissella beninensis TaxID=504936 RepID=A0ABT0VHR7_9LACO|nr:hypothetical protein [Periweissella beninensis]MBM7544059.1 hypothetical protein [Periweissella beninensis]MCM2437384.1 hypothetical protein [Periweissella beninensis]MCT4396884.1 hypothetical protein [Periweissella beninensis]
MKPITKIISLIIAVIAVGVGSFILVNKNNTPSYEIANPQTPASIEQAKYDRKHPFFIGKTFVGSTKQTNMLANKKQTIVWTVSISFKKNHTFQQYADNANDVSVVIQGTWRIVNDKIKLKYNQNGYVALYNQDGKDLAQGLPYTGKKVHVTKQTIANQLITVPKFKINGNILERTLLLSDSNNKKSAVMSISDGQAVLSVINYQNLIKKQIDQQVKQVSEGFSEKQKLAAILISYRDANKANRKNALKIQKIITENKKIYVKQKNNIWLIANSKQATPFLAIKEDITNGFSYANVKKVSKKIKIEHYQKFANANLRTFIPKYILQQTNNINQQQDYLKVQKNIKEV